VFVEFPGASGAPVVVHRECIGMITIGSPQKLNGSDVFFDEVRVYWREGFGGFVSDEDGYTTFMVDDEYLSYWLQHWREALGVPEFPKTEEKA
jgi:hypothetical protein